MTLDDERMNQAIDAIARTPDGLVLYLYFQKQLSAVPVNPDLHALREIHGRRMFAAELMAAMAKGIRETHGGSDPTERPITFLARDPVRVAGRESVRAFLARTDSELAAGRTGKG